MGFFDEGASTIGFGKTKAAPNSEGAALDPRYVDTVTGTAKSAVDYRKNIPNLRQQKINVATDSARYGLARSMADADKIANRRGMFYGGVRGGLRADAQSQVANDLANNIRGINVGLEDTAQGLEETAIEGAFGLRDQQQSVYDQAYNEALSQREKLMGNSGLQNNIAKGIGGSLGGIVGRKKEQGPPKAGEGAQPQAGTATDYNSGGYASRTA